MTFNTFRVLAIGLAVVVTGCMTTTDTNGNKVVSYQEVVTDTQNAYSILKVSVDGLVAQGKVPAAVASKVEADAETALAALASTGGVTTINPQALAQQALNAILAVQRVAPVDLLPSPVLTGMQVAETALAAYLALDPASAVAVKAAPARPRMLLHG